MRTTSPVIGQSYRDWLTKFEGICTCWIQEPDRQVAALAKDTGASMLVPAARLAEVEGPTKVAEVIENPGVEILEEATALSEQIEASTAAASEQPVEVTNPAAWDTEPEPDVMPDFSEAMDMDAFREGVRKAMELAKTTDTRPLRSTLEKFKARTLVDVPEDRRAEFLEAVRKTYEKEAS